jgi:hypothetical protein
MIAGRARESQNKVVTRNKLDIVVIAADLERGAIDGFYKDGSQVLLNLRKILSEVEAKGCAKEGSTG